MRYKNDKGSILVFVVIIMMVATVMITSILTMTKMNLFISKNRTATSIKDYNAEDITINFKAIFVNNAYKLNSLKKYDSNKTLYENSQKIMNEYLSKYKNILKDSVDEYNNSSNYFIEIDNSNKIDQIKFTVYDSALKKKGIFKFELNAKIDTLLRKENILEYIKEKINNANDPVSSYYNVNNDNKIDKGKFFKYRGIMDIDYPYVEKIVKGTSKFVSINLGKNNYEAGTKNNPSVYFVSDLKTLEYLVVERKIDYAVIIYMGLFNDWYDYNTDSAWFDKNRDNPNYVSFKNDANYLTHINELTLCLGNIERELPGKNIYVISRGEQSIFSNKKDISKDMYISLIDDILYNIRLTKYVNLEDDSEHTLKTSYKAEIIEEILTELLIQPGEKLRNIDECISINKITYFD